MRQRAGDFWNGLIRRTLLLAAVPLLACAAIASAQGWKPEKPVEIVIGTSPGGPQDRTGGLVQRVLQERKLVEPPVTVVNKPGGGGAVGLAYLAQHRGDGHHMMIVAQPLLSNHQSDSVFTVLSQARAGRVRVIAVGAPKRWLGEFASAPTWKELGLNSALDLWRGLAGPKGMSAAQVAFWDAALARVVKDEEWRKDLDFNLMDNVYKNSAETLKHWQTEYEEVKTILTDLGLAK